MAFCIAQVMLIQRTPLTQPAPLVGASAIALPNTDDPEQLYVFSQMLGRIQVFDTNGTFQTSIATPTVKGELTLCGGGEHPILLVTPYFRKPYYELKQKQFIWVEDQPLPGFCQTSKPQTTAIGQYRYRLKDWPKRVTYRSMGQHQEDILIPGNWWIAFSGSLPFILGYGLLGGGLQILGLILLYSHRHQEQS
ncbi:hypothetical protein [Acaryochloris sp. IP29b_bin.148]|uniref:hypothetical protein n=1 Tax=Acaryochloris sp. IP29b_bin.148 TaxID=2969218 RepID=UPI0026247D79|nr:hypothetical protein [Acaryochloris sp. IP29b_bin.148]